MSLALATISCVLLALVAGLLLLLGQLLRGMRKELREAPLLAEKLAQQLLAVRSGLEQAKHEIHQAAGKLGPDWANQVQAAQTTLNDLKFLIARGEQVASKLETSQQNGKLGGTVTVHTEKTVEIPAPVVTASADPLESLLADLEETAPVSRRPSQAEVALRAKDRN